MLAHCTERRRRRSADPLWALRFQLDYCRARAEFDALLVSDEDGLCLARSGSFETCDEIAARLPMVARALDYFEGEIASGGRPLKVTMRRFRGPFADLFVCGVGGHSRDRQQHLLRSAAGVARILHPTRPRHAQQAKITEQ